MKKFFLTFLLILPLCGLAQAKIDCGNVGKIFFAVMDKNTDYIKQYMDQNCSLDVTDDRGYTLYDRAALKGHQRVMDLIATKNPVMKNKFSKQLIKLLQIGFRSMDIDAGVMNGKMTEDLVKAIKYYQSQIKVPVTGKISSNWLAIFEKTLIKEVQNELNALGFQLGKADGIIGSRTREAIQDFRKEEDILKPEYGYLDDQLIYHIMVSANDQHKIDRKKKIEAAKQAAEKAKADAIRRKQQEKQRAIAAQKAAALKKQREQAAALKKQANEKQSEKEQANLRNTQIENAKTVVKEHKTTEAIVKPTTVAKPKVASSGSKQFRKISGVLTFHGSKTQCSIQQQTLDATWCGNYYSTSNGKQCDAVVSQDGDVVSLVCR